MRETPLPPVLIRQNALVAALPPGSNPDARHWRGGGLFHGDGLPDLAAAPMMVDQPPLDAERLASAENLPEGLFCGRFRGHFGHFLAESIGRLWAVDQMGPDMPLIWFSDPRQTGTGRIRKALLAALNIRNPQIIVTGALRVETLLLPPSLTDPLYKITPDVAYQAWFNSRLSEKPEVGPDLYLSRLKMPAAAGRFFGEEDIEAGLRAEGYRVIYPELLSTDAQISAYRAARRIVVAEGSPLHLLALLDVPGQKIASLMRRPRIVGTLAPALLAFRQSELFVIDRIVKTWGSGANGNLFSVVSELDMAAVWADLAGFGFITDAGRKPVPGPEKLTVERKTVAPDRTVRLAIKRRGME